MPENYDRADYERCERGHDGKDEPCGQSSGWLRREEASGFSRCPNTAPLLPHRNGKDRWAVILAGGNGNRLKPLTRLLANDDERPKQFCRILNDRTLLEETQRRTALLIPPSRTITVVTRAHHRYYEAFLADAAAELVLVQPENRGTAPAILCSLLRLASVEPDSSVAFFPSDHYFSDDHAFMSCVALAFDEVNFNPERVILLGVRPTSPEAGYGWIEPDGLVGGFQSQAIRGVRRFWEKPAVGLAQTLMSKGGLWNIFVMVGRAAAFLELIRRATPVLYKKLSALVQVPASGAAAQADLLTVLYSQLPSVDFSRSVLAVRPMNLAVLPLNDVGWTDLGEPKRILRILPWIADSEPIHLH